MPRRGALRPRARALIICAAVALLLCLWASLFSLLGGVDILRRAAVAVSSPVTGLLSRAGGSIEGALLALRTDYAAWQNEKAQLRADLIATQAQLAEMDQLRRENEELRTYLGLGERERRLDLIETKVLYTADTTRRLAVIDRGSRDGVARGMAVLDGAGLVGIVWEVSGGSAKVATLCDDRVSVGVYNARTGLTGLCTGLPAGHEKEAYLKLSYMDASSDRSALRVGDRMVTSGGSEMYPAGLLVGQVVEVGYDPYDMTPYAYIRPAADLTDTTAYLMVVAGEREAEPSRPDPEETEETEENQQENTDIPATEDGEGDAS